VCVLSLLTPTYKNCNTDRKAIRASVCALFNTEFPLVVVACTSSNFCQNNNKKQVLIIHLVRLRMGALLLDALKGHIPSIPPQLSSTVARRAIAATSPAVSISISGAETFIPVC